MTPVGSITRSSGLFCIIELTADVVNLLAMVSARVFTIVTSSFTTGILITN